MAKTNETISVADTAPAATPEHHLVVIHPFGNYRRGDLISEVDEIATVKSGENHHHCHKVKPQ